MDVISLLKSSYSDYGTILSDTWYALLKKEIIENVSVIKLNRF